MTGKWIGSVRRWLPASNEPGSRHLLARRTDTDRIGRAAFLKALAAAASRSAVGTREAASSAVVSVTADALFAPG